MELFKTKYRQKLLLEKLESDLGSGVGLGDHCSARLNEDVRASELRRFGSDVYVVDAAVSGFEVDLVHVERIKSELEAACLSSIRSHERRNGLDRCGHRADVSTGEARESAHGGYRSVETSLIDGHRLGTVVRQVNSQCAGRSREESDAVELVSGKLTELREQVVELGGVVRGVVARLGHIASEGCEFRHPIQNCSSALEGASLSLKEREGVRDVGCRVVSPLDGSS